MRKILILFVVILLFLVSCSSKENIDKSIEEQITQPLVGPPSRINIATNDYNMTKNGELSIPITITYSVPSKPELRFNIKVESNDNDSFEFIYDQNEYSLKAKESIEILPLKIISKNNGGKFLVIIKLIDLDNPTNPIFDSKSFFVNIK